ncbi:hypothetical protein FEM48_Zijuj06G0073700 [Ziziphus jujuba var. spinosa]|uniref:Uncharacterized protein n=1 Tax=Ziziphus jujuba var. spinosa TaxID=714518 RepID=A0A978V7Y2_ZIZJJ|nr:hypothetical protein FEM48_Zijuj06G0073700 [Ziziphus jujuba var. spinosa]
MKKIAKELDDTLDKSMEEHKRKRERGTDQLVKEEQDFMDVMLSLLEDYSDSAGGTETTIITVLWAISLLLNNHHVMKKAKDELDSQVGRERVVEESDINKLVYLQAIVKETLRLYPAAPLSGPRELIQDCNIGGYHITKRTRLITNIWKIQTDPKIWEEPLEFKPKRFLTTHKDVGYRS